jgi:Flp pilus assembly protein CpaB
MQLRSRAAHPLHHCHVQVTEEEEKEEKVVEIAQNLFSTRRGSLLVGAAAAVVAGIVLLAYLHNYRASVNSNASSAPVLVAKNLIEKGTPGNIVGETNQFQVASIPKAQLQIGALSDPVALRGRVAAVDIFPGQQLTAADFVYATPGTLTTSITRNQRAISVPIDAAHSVNGALANGDHVDVFLGINRKTPTGSQAIIKLLLQDIELLRAPYGNVATLKVTQRQAAALAWAVDNGKLWFVLRPPSGATTPNPGLITADSLLTLRPVR